MLLSFISSELEIVFSDKRKDLRLRPCGFPSLFTLLDIDNLNKVGCCILVDKEKIGIVGLNAI